jgi:hypothetical protein
MKSALAKLEQAQPTPVLAKWAHTLAFPGTGEQDLCGF